MLDSLPKFHFFDCGNSYCGEHYGMRYYLEKRKTEEEKQLYCELWPEPWCREQTPDEEKQNRLFEFTPDGLAQAISWMKQKYEQEQEHWETARKEPWSVSVEKHNQWLQRMREEKERMKSE